LTKDNIARGSIYVRIRGTAIEKPFNAIESVRNRTPARDPRTNCQVERMNRMIKEATVKRYHYESRDQLEAHLAALLDAYNFAKRLKAL